jgi:hypothetical protein
MATELKAHSVVKTSQPTFPTTPTMLSATNSSNSIPVSEGSQSSPFIEEKIRKAKSCGDETENIKSKLTLFFAIDINLVR